MADSETHGPDGPAGAGPGPANVPRGTSRPRCCARDTDGDGNCPVHSAPGVTRVVHTTRPRKYEDTVRIHDGAVVRPTRALVPEGEGNG
jgi:hypothetical protein